jgi:hypothetical protein
MPPSLRNFGRIRRPPPNGVRRSKGTVAAVLVLASSLAAARCSSDETGAGTSPEPAAAAGVDDASEPVRSFVEFAQELSAEEPLQPADIAEGMRRLAGAAGTLGAIPPELGAGLRIGAEHVLLNPEGADVSATVHGTLTRVAASLEEAPNAQAIQDAAGALRADAPITQQSAALRRYFGVVAQALQAHRSAGS